MVKINKEEEKARRAEEKKIMIEERRAEVFACKTLESLQELGKRRGYKSNWAKHVFESRKGRK